MHYSIAYAYVPPLLINQGFAEWILMSGFFYCSPLLVPFLTLLVRYILAPTLTVSWQGIVEGGLLGVGVGGGWVAVLAGRRPVAVVVGGLSFRRLGGLLLWCRRWLFMGCLSCNRGTM